MDQKPKVQAWNMDDSTAASNDPQMAEIKQTQVVNASYAQIGAELSEEKAAEADVKDQLTTMQYRQSWIGRMQDPTNLG